MSQLLPILRVVHQNSPQFADQVKALFALFPELSYELVAVRPKVSDNEGIYDDSPFSAKKPGMDLHRKLVLGTADLAVHPAHELPYPVGDGLEVLALIDATTLIQSPETSSQNNLVIVSKEGRGDVKAIFSTADLRTGYGRVILVGFGPGNPDLLTLGGDKALTAADIIFHDDLVDKEFLQKYTGEKVYVGKRKDRHSVRQEEINQFLLRAAKSGKNVVRLKGGDPMVFAHGGEEIEFLQRNLVEVAVIPGVSAGIAVAAYTKVPLTHRGIASSVAFVSGHSDAFQIPATDTLVYYMAGSKIRLIARNAIARGKNPKTPAMLVYNISLPDQQNFFYTLEELADCEKIFPTPLTIVIGKVVSLRHKTEDEVLNPALLIT